MLLAETNTPWGAHLRLISGDLARHAADALVNAANGSLLGGSGVDGALHKAGGPEILAACRLLRTGLPHGLAAGKALSTTAGDLSARRLIHAVGPRYGIDEPSDRLLAEAYRAALTIACNEACTSVAFPAISMGAYAFPATPAAQIALNTVWNWQCRVHAACPIRRVDFVLYTPEASAAFAAALKELTHGA